MRDAGEPRHRCLRGLVTIVACASIALGAPAAALASNHLVKLRELYAGSGAHPNDEYVEVQMYKSGENFLSQGASLHLYDAGGNQTLDFMPTTNVPNGQNQRRVLFATPGAQASFGVTGDYMLPAANQIADAGGAACYVSGFPGYADCVSWGNFTGNLPSAPSGNVDPTSGIADGMAIDRSIARGCETLLEGSDDTDAPSDWSDGLPDPLNNSATPHEHACPNTKITKGPKARTTDRTPKFKFRSSRNPATFKCKVDSKPFKKCASPFTTKRLKLGKHVFKVRAFAGGGSDPTPAVKRFKVVRRP